MLIAFSFFFSSRRRHTRFDCDWSSDVCSSDLPFPTRTYTTAQSPAACILHPRTANAYTVGPSPAPGSVRCLQLLGRTWLAPIPESRDHPLHRPFLDKLISENGPAENPQEIILNSLPCKCLFLWDLSRHRFQPDCLLRPLKIRNCLTSDLVL